MLRLEGINGKKYKLFIDFAIKTCDTVSMVFKKSDTNHSEYYFQEEYLLVSESIIKRENVAVHPNTGSCLDNADVLYLKIDAQASSILKRADSFFDWNGSQLPEELCFYRDEEIWFTCICHERLVFIHNETSNDVEFLKNNRIRFVCE